MLDFATPLCELAFRYGSDKSPQIKHHYTPWYYEVFSGRRNTIRKVLEIGVGGEAEMRWTGVPGYVTGASVHMWSDFFPKALIYGADIREDTVFHEGRIQTFQCDQSDPAQLLQLLAHTGTDIDLCIDDASHQVAHQILTAQTLMPLLQHDVLYIIEDVGHPNEVAAGLPEYDCEPIRAWHKSSRDDQLLIVKRK